MATTIKSYDGVTEAFDRVYAQLREDNGENAPNSYTWHAPTLDGLIEELESSGLGGELAERIECADGEPAPDATIGHDHAPTVAWIYECNGDQLYRVTEGASPDELTDAFRRCVGYDD